MRKAKLKMQNLALNIFHFAWAPRGERGLTLIEVVLTVALVALVLGLVLPRIGITPSLAQSSRHLAGAIQSLSTAAAASSNRTYRLHIDLDRQLYWATLATSDGDRLPSDPSLAFRTALASPMKVEAVTTGRHGKVTAGKVVIEFFPGGRTDQAMIHLSNDDGRMVVLVLNPLTGAVHVSDRSDPEPPKASIPEAYREWFTALPPPPTLPVQQAQQAVQP
jgi:Tfp pilus assembly protein FimT